MATKLPTFLTRGERAVLLNAAARTAPRGVPHGGLRDAALIALLVFSGLRIAEACALDRSDLEFGDKPMIHVRHGKGEKERYVPLRDEAAVAITEYLKTRSDDEPAVFISRRGTRADKRTLRNVVYRVVKEAKLTKRISPHKLRHTFATLAYEGGADLLGLQLLLGHESSVTTQIYTHVGVDRLRSIVDNS